jgi:hypothetical protein
MDRQKVIVRYGREWKSEAGLTLLDVEYAAFLQRRTVEQGGLGAEQHFKNLTRILWPPDKHGKGGYTWLSDDPDLAPEYWWNDRYLDACLANQFVGITGPASSMKTEFAAVWLIVNWLPRFQHCMGIAASLTKATAKTKVWGAVKERFRKVEWMGIGKYMDFPNAMISGNKGDAATKHLSDRSAIILVAPDVGKEGEEVGKLQGLKQEWVFCVSDELAAMTPAITNATSNWMKNPHFHFLGLGNMGSPLDTMGRFFAPADGWDNVSVRTPQWKCTNGGVLIHVDGEETPNKYTRPPNKYAYVIKTTDLDQDAAIFGRTSARYWMFDRGFPPPGGTEENLYSEMELIIAGCMESPTWRGEPPTGLAAMDPNYSKGHGDNCMAKFGQIGVNKEGLKVLDIGGAENEMALREDVEKLDEGSATKQKAVQFATECRKRQIGIRQVVVDCTGGGSLMADAVEDAFGERGLLRIEFGGSPSDRVIEKRDDEEIKASDRFDNKAAEIWHAGIKFVKSRQLKGLTSKDVEQMGSRKIVEKGKKVAMESKKDYKLRTQKPSCDEADTSFQMLDLAIQRFGFDATNMLASRGRGTDWKSAMSKFKAPAEAGGERRLQWTR